VVYGLVYTISASDEATLDAHEGVPNMYSKLYLPITMGSEERPGIRQRSLVYIDVNVKDPAPAPQEYIDRMNEAIEDCRRVGMPESYIEKYLRAFIPPAN
jgi:gamma-glutamylcyclotransferase